MKKKFKEKKNSRAAAPRHATPRHAAGHFCFKPYNFESMKDIQFIFFFSIKYKASSAYNCLTDPKNINAKYFSKHLLFFLF